MTITWSFDGTDLSDFGKITAIDGYLDMPQRRGGNQIIPFQHGTMHAGKYYDERRLTFGITINQPNAADLESTMDDLRKLIAPRTQKTLSLTREDASVLETQAIVDAPLQVARVTNTLARVIVEFVMPRPFFRLDTAIADNTTTINTSPKAMTVTNPGTIEEREPIITLTGPLQNTTITNTTVGVSMTYTGTIAGGEVVTISTNSYGEFTATSTAGGGTNVIGNISHNGAAALMVLDVGSNTLSVTDSTATTGTVKVSFHAPYL